MATILYPAKIRIDTKDPETMRTLGRMGISKPDEEGFAHVIVGNGTYLFVGPNVRMSEHLVCATRFWLAIDDGKQEWGCFTMCNTEQVSELAATQAQATPFYCTEDPLTCLVCLARV